MNEFTGILLVNSMYSVRYICSSDISAFKFIHMSYFHPTHLNAEWHDNGQIKGE